MGADPDRLDHERGEVGVRQFPGVVYHGPALAARPALRLTGDVGVADGDLLDDDAGDRLVEVC